MVDFSIISTETEKQKKVAGELEIKWVVSYSVVICLVNSLIIAVSIIFYFVAQS